jgi:hypothetical protein
VELKASAICHVGPCDAASYPIAKKKTTYEFLREKMHLRPRANTIGAVARIRNALAFATHRFFQVGPEARGGGRVGGEKGCRHKQPGTPLRQGWRRCAQQSCAGQDRCLQRSA